MVSEPRCITRHQSRWYVYAKPKRAAGSSYSYTTRGSTLLWPTHPQVLTFYFIASPHHRHTHAYSHTYTHTYSHSYCRLFCPSVNCPGAHEDRTKVTLSSSSLLFHLLRSDFRAVSLIRFSSSSNGEGDFFFLSESILRF